MQGYDAKIMESSCELSAKDRIKMKDTTVTKSLDELTKEAPVDIHYGGYVIIAVHNEKSDHKDYTKYVIWDKDNDERYATGSESFWSAFQQIYNEMLEEGEEDFSIRVYRKPSKNYVGRDFITCTVL